MKDNAGVPRNPQNLVTSVMSFVNKPVVVVKTAKELEEEKEEARWEAHYACPDSQPDF